MSMRIISCGRSYSGAILAILNEAIENSTALYDYRARTPAMMGIDSQNAASIALHRRLGFERCAHIRQAGFKFNRWLDLQFYQLLLKTPAQPVDG